MILVAQPVGDRKDGITSWTRKTTFTRNEGVPKYVP